MFVTTWFEDHKWLTYCLTRNKVYCYFCRTAVRRQLINFSKNAKDTFVTIGFDNWKKGKERFKEHERCQAHLEACMKLESLLHPSVSRLSSQLLSDQMHHREMFMKECHELDI